jgi:hypothetical protein
MMRTRLQTSELSNAFKRWNQIEELMHNLRKHRFLVTFHDSQVFGQHQTMYRTIQYVFPVTYIMLYNVVFTCFYWVCVGLFSPPMPQCTNLREHGNALIFRCQRGRQSAALRIEDLMTLASFAEKLFECLNFWNSTFL